jgi:lycopene beta-cyclase
MSEATFSATDGSERYFCIFTGTGCAALSLVMRMIKTGRFNDRKILLIDKEPKTKNDRTWCFWEKQNGFFEDIVYKKWDRLSFFGDHYSSALEISPYQYKMIRGIDFYNYCFGEIAKHPNIEIIYGEASLINEQGKIVIKLNGQDLPASDSIVFNSFSKDDINLSSGISLLQHFKGWIIETPTPVFDPSIATFMDFRVDQKRGTTFAYVLPFSTSKALIEYTLFTENVLIDEEYEGELRSYLDKVLKLQGYKITGKEFGVIPMSTKQFQFYDGQVYNIGTSGGQTKASSGYTFQFIQKQSGMIVDHFIQHKDLRRIPGTPGRFRFYDKVLLDVLHNDRVTGKTIFTTMFKKNKPQQVLKFLDNESTIAEELKIISTLPTIPFLKAAINQF